MVSRFMRLVNLDALQNYDHLKALCALAWGLMNPGDDKDDGNNLPAILSARATTLDALALAADLASDDEPESRILRHEQEYFGSVGSARLAAARKQCWTETFQSTETVSRFS